MKLYTFEAAPNPKRVHLLMQYKGIEMELIPVDMMSREQRSEEYGRINPLQTLPALVLDDGTLLTEVISICTYLEAIYPQKPLMGGEPLEKAQILGWSHWLFTQIFMPTADVFRNGNPAFAGHALPGTLALEQIPDLVERGKARLADNLPKVNNHLAGKDFIMGDAFTFADTELLAWMSFMKMARQSLPDSCTNIAAWQERATAALG
ncbi:MAG: glutathione S-transferase family protein [Halieaceae bacterium]